jgi:hypothetical protein
MGIPKIRYKEEYTIQTYVLSDRLPYYKHMSEKLCLMKKEKLNPCYLQTPYQLVFFVSNHALSY